MIVLIVDDSKTMRTIIKGALQKGGISSIVEAVNGKEAVAAVMADQVDIILMDWNMPEMNGLEAVKTIRAAGNDCTIMMVTTEAEKHRVIEALQSGVNDYLVKPFTPDALMDKISKYVGV